MSKFLFSASSLLDFNGFVSTGSQPTVPFLLEMTSEAKDALSDDSKDNYLVFKEYRNRTIDVTVDLTSTTGAAGEAVALQSVRFAQVAIIKTAETVTGTVAITIPQFGITSGTLNIGNMAAALAATPIGGVIHTLIGYNAGGIAVGATADTVDFTSPVGFAAHILYIGDKVD